MGCTGLYWAALDCTGLYLALLEYTGLHWDLIGWGGHWSGGSGGPVIQVIQVVQVVQVIRMISIDDMHSENIWFSWSKSSNYREKLRCHACDGRTNGQTDGKWKIEQCSVRPETAIFQLQNRMSEYFPNFLLVSYFYFHC